MAQAGNNRKSAIAAHRIRADGKEDVDTVVMLRDDGKNVSAWFNKLDGYFQSKFELIGSFLEDDEYHRRQPWSAERFAQYERLTGASEKAMSILTREKVKDYFDQIDKDVASYANMYGTIWKTLSPGTQARLRSVDGFDEIKENKRPLQLVRFIKANVVNATLGMSADAAADAIIRRWQKLACGATEDAIDFCERAEQLWNALTTARHPERPELLPAVRFVTRLLVGNHTYIPYVTSVINNSQIYAIGDNAFAASFAEIALKADSYVTVNGGTRRRGAGVAYACSVCNIEGHDDDNCFKQHPEKAPDWWVHKGAKGGHKSDRKPPAAKKAAEADDKPSGAPKKKNRRSKKKESTAYATLMENMAFGI